MSDQEISSLVAKLGAVVDLLCRETAHLVDDRATRAPAAQQDGIRGKAQQLREAADALRLAFPKVE
jgi:hypothetical protein